MESPSQTSATQELAYYGGFLRRRWLIIVSFAILGLLFGVVTLHAQHKVYSSTASVLVSSTGVPSSSTATGQRTNSDINLDTEAQLVKSTAVADAAKALLRSSLPSTELVDQVTVTVPANTSVLAIEFTGSTPQAAQQGAHAFAQAYLNNRSAVAKNDIKAQTSDAQAQLKTLTKQLQDVTGQIASLPSNSPDRVYASAQQTVLVGQISALSQRLSPLESATVTPGTIINDAQLPTGPSSPKPLLFLASGLLAGLLLGFVLAAVRDRADQRVRRAADVEETLEIPVLAEVTRLRRDEQQHLVPARRSAARPFQQLRNALVAQFPAGETFLVTGASVGNGSSVVATNLAAALARGGSQVTLVCADPGSAGTARLLGLRQGPGLTDVLTGSQQLSSVLQTAADLPTLKLLAPGTAELPGGLLPAEAVGGILAQLRPGSGYVVIDAPSAAATADAQGLARYAGAAIVVAEVPRTRRGQVVEVAEQLGRVGAKLLGVVLIPVCVTPKAVQGGRDGAASVSPAALRSAAEDARVSAAR